MASKTKPNPCVECPDYCIRCVGEGKHRQRNPYPLPVREGKKEHYNSYLRWVIRHESGIEHFSSRHYEKADQVEEIKWLLNHPKVAYQLVNSDQVENNTKIARILVRLLNPDKSYMASMWIGRPGMGKTWGCLWAAENFYRATQQDRRWWRRLYGGVDYDKIQNKSFAYLTYSKNIHLPPWMDAITSIPEIPNNCYLIVDEGGIQAPSRRAMKKENVTLSQLINIRRHKDIALHFIVQEPEDIDRSIRRQMDYFFLKPYSLTTFDSKLMQKLYSFIPEGEDRKSVV